MASEERAIEVLDFEFHALRKVRLSKEPLHGDSSKKLAISSSYGIGIAIVSANRILSFHTSDVHAQKADRTNLNDEVTNVRTRTTNYFDEKASLLAASCNCDGTLLGVLADTTNGPMVHIFDAASFSVDYQGHIAPINAIRVSATAEARARCFEWSPAAADTLVAAASDKSLVTVVVKESSSYTMLGERKLGAAVRTISWSRKGKQLVIGDDLGKVIQMKPELDIVRSTMPPDTCKIANPAVVGLCWMTTTEFLVVYGNAASKDVQATIMITKKDKPITWTDLPDLSYGSPHSAMAPAVNTLCMLEWNAILSTSSRSSEVSVVGKALEAWQVWVPDELCQASLPTNAATAETFPVGAELDLSASEPLVLSEDGEKRASPSPIICILTTDGVLMSFHTVNLKPGAPSMQVARKAVNPATIRVGPKPAGTGGQTVAAAATAAVSVAPAAAPASTARKSLFGAPPTTAAAAAIAASSPQQQSDPLSVLSQSKVCSPNVKPLGTPTASGSLFGAVTPAAAAAPATQTPAAAPVGGVSVAAIAAEHAAAAAKATQEATAKAEEEKQRKLVEDREKVNVLLQEVQNEATALVDELARMKDISATARPTIAEMEEQLKEEERKKMHGLDGYVKELEEEERRNERIVKAAMIRIGDRVRMVEEAGEGAGALAAMRKDYDYDREESISQLARRITNARTTMAEVQKEVQRMRTAPQSSELYEPDAKWTSDRVERMNGTIKNIQKIVKLEREKVEDVEALVRNVVQLKLSDDEVRKEKTAMERIEKPNNVKVIMMKKESAAKPKELTPAELADARKRLLNAKTLFPFPAPRRFVPEHEKRQEKSSVGVSMNETVMNKSLLNASSTPFLFNSPLRTQLEERLLEATKPRKAIQLPALEKFAIKQESRPAALREPPPSPIVPAAASAAPKPAAAAVPAKSIFGGAPAAPSFRLGEPQASSTPNKAAAPTAPAAGTSLFGKPTTAAAPTTSIFGASDAATKAKESEKTEEDKKKDDEATPATAKLTTPSIFGGASTITPTGAATTPSIFGKPPTADASLVKDAAASTAATATDAATTPVTPVDATAPAAAATTTPEEKKEEEKKEEANKPVTFSFGGAAAAATAAVTPTSSAFGGGAATDTTKPATSSIFGGGATTDASKPATSSIFGAGATTDSAKSATSSIFGGGTSTAPTDSPAKSIFGTPAAAPTSPFGGAAATTTQPKSIFGGGVAAAPVASSPFGSAAVSAASPATTSIFGGGAAPQQQASNSPFGSAFSKPATSASTFSFKSAAAAASSDATAKPSSGFGQSTSIFGGGTTQTASSGFGSAAPSTTSSFGSVFGGANKPAASGFAAAAAAAAADEGMDDGGSNGGFGGGGGGGFMGGLGSTTSANAGKNVFGGGFGSGTATNTQASSIFGKSTSAFGAKPSTFGAAPTTTSAFGGGASAFGSAASPSAFGAASSPSTGFGAKPAFGSGPSFGAKSIFGGAASPQQPAATSAFGGGTAGGGFAAFANKGGGFGSVAAQQPAGGSSIFGGGVNQAKPASSIFGGGTTAGTTNKFSSWR